MVTLSVENISYSYRTKYQIVPALKELYATVCKVLCIDWKKWEWKNDFSFSDSWTRTSTEWSDFGEWQGFERNECGSVSENTGICHLSKF